MSESRPAGRWPGPAATMLAGSESHQAACNSIRLYTETAAGHGECYWYRLLIVHRPAGGSRARSRTGPGGAGRGGGSDSDSPQGGQPEPEGPAGGPGLRQAAQYHESRLGPSESQSEPRSLAL